jgi:hypothetical protein
VELETDESNSLFNALSFVVHRFRTIPLAQWHDLLREKMLAMLSIGMQQNQCSGSEKKTTG